MLQDTGTATPSLTRKSVSRREFLKLATRLAAGGTIAAAGGLGYTMNIEPYWIDIQNISLTLARLQQPFTSYKVAQISDLHLGDWLKRSQLEQVVSLVNGHNPDLIAITGTSLAA